MPENRKAFCGTVATTERSSARSRSRTSTPSMLTRPSVASRSRGSRPTSVVLPDPVEPMTAVIVPGAISKSISARTREAAPG